MIFVIGAVGEKESATELDVELRDALSDYLARHVHAARVIDGAAIRSFLRDNRISEKMLYSITLADMIANHGHADGFVAVQIAGISGSRLSVTTELRTKKKGFRSVRGFASELTLNDQQIQASKHSYQPEPKFPTEKSGEKGVTNVECMFCPTPDFSEEARQVNYKGEILLELTVRPDGVADEVFVIKPGVFGLGIDSKAVDAVLKWKFKPAQKDGHPVAVVTQIQVVFQLF
jgi:TonB family protein